LAWVFLVYKHLGHTLFENTFKIAFLDTTLISQLHLAIASE